MKIGNVKKALEIGVFTGYSSLCIASGLPSDGKLVALDISKEFTDIARRYWVEAGVEDKIDCVVGPALASLDKMLDDGQAGTFDFAFLDADKAHYDLYYERMLKLVRFSRYSDSLEEIYSQWFFAGSRRRNAYDRQRPVAW
jgi:predicted O-methyltransferase YrrM